MKTHLERMPIERLRRRGNPEEDEHDEGCEACLRDVPCLATFTEQHIARRYDTRVAHVV